MANPLDAWVAGEGDDFTVVQRPILITEFAAPELLPYHPSVPDQAPCRFRFVASGDGRHARVELHPEDPWNEDFAALMKSLKLRVEAPGEAAEHLLDDRIGDSPVRMGRSDWRATSWRIDRFADEGQRVLREWITWTDKDGRVAETFYQWKPYRPVAIA